MALVSTDRRAVGDLGTGRTHSLPGLWEVSVSDCGAVPARTSSVSPKSSSAFLRVKDSNWVMNLQALPGKCCIIFSVSSFIKMYAECFVSQPKC